MRTQGEDSLLQTKEWVFTRHQPCSRFHLGLQASRNVSKCISVVEIPEPVVLCWGSSSKRIKVLQPFRRESWVLEDPVPWSNSPPVTQGTGGRDRVKPLS